MMPLLRSIYVLLLSLMALALLPLSASAQPSSSAQKITINVDTSSCEQFGVNRSSFSPQKLTGAPLAVDITGKFTLSDDGQYQVIFKLNPENFSCNMQTGFTTCSNVLKPEKRFRLITQPTRNLDTDGLIVGGDIKTIKVSCVS